MLGVDEVGLKKIGSIGIAVLRKIQKEADTLKMILSNRVPVKNSTENMTNVHIL